MQFLNWRLVRRLKEIEERILEREVWNHGQLYELLKEEHDKSFADDFLGSPRSFLYSLTH
jgi:hypothetical protein